ncbi:hypothetical protein ACFXHA_08995 [Nocardia sp. NPDC059240]|uniref:hypothetical protein n=1 Tax=Nocardia sp. NPDC059240 TaxID=3346786 RepID=UPI0036937984
MKGFEVQVRKIGFAATALVAAAAVGTALAGSAGASPSDWKTTVSVSGTAATGCTAQITATVVGDSSLGLGAPANYPPVEFWDGTTFLGRVVPTLNQASPGNLPSFTAQLSWTPTTTGAQWISANYVGGNYTPAVSGSTLVTVGTGLNLGSVCIPLG